MTRKEWLEREAKTLRAGIEKAEALIAELQQRLKDAEDALAEIGNET